MTDNFLQASFPSAAQAECPMYFSACAVILRSVFRRRVLLHARPAPFVSLTAAVGCREQCPAVAFQHRKQET